MFDTWIRTDATGGVPGQRLGMARALSPETETLLNGAVGVLFLVAGVGGLLVDTFSHDALVHPFAIGIVSSAAVAIGAGLLLVAQRDPGWVHERFAEYVHCLIVAATLLITAAQYSAGPHVVVALPLYVEVPIFAFYLLRRGAAFGTRALIGVQFGVLLAV
jgi:hypothetical protein